MSVLDRYREPSGQPKLLHDDVRIALDVRLCEPDNPVRRGSVALCPGTECQRVVFRSAGENPCIVCVCGVTFNCNYSVVGQTPFPWPKDGKLILEGEPDDF